MLQDRNNDLNKNIEDVLFSHSALAAEYDKLFDSSKRHESRVLESVQFERESLLASMEKQKKILESAIEEQKEMVNEAHQKESNISELLGKERKKQQESIMKIKDFSNHHNNISAREHLISHSRAPSPEFSTLNGTWNSNSDTSNSEQRSDVRESEKDKSIIINYHHSVHKDNVVQHKTKESIKQSSETSNHQSSLQVQQKELPPKG